MDPLRQSSKRPGLRRSVFAYPTGQCLALSLPQLPPFAVPATAAGSRRMACGIYASMPVRGSICDSHYALGLRKRSLPLSLSLAGRGAVTVVLRSAKRSRRTAHAVHSSPLTACARTRILKCIRAEGKARAGEPRGLRQKKSAGTLRLAGALQLRYIVFFAEVFVFKGGAGLKLAGKSVPVVISPGFAMMSFFVGPRAASNSFFSFSGTLNSSSVLTRFSTTALNSPSVTPI